MTATLVGRQAPRFAGEASPAANGIRTYGSGGSDYRALARQTAEQFGIDPDLFEAQIQQESNFNPRAVSSSGAMGLGQLMPGTARELGVKDPFNPVENLRGAARYMQQQLAAFNNDHRLALAAYNAGPGAVRKAGGIPAYRETQNYVSKITKDASSIKSGKRSMGASPGAPGQVIQDLATAASPAVTGPGQPAAPGWSGTGRMAGAAGVGGTLAALASMVTPKPVQTDPYLALADHFEAASRGGSGEELFLAALGGLSQSPGLQSSAIQNALAVLANPSGRGQVAPAAGGQPEAAPAPAATSSLQGGRTITLQQLAKAFQNKGLTVRENALLGTPVGRHSSGSHHYHDDAFDLTVQQGSKLLAGRPDSDWPVVTREIGDKLKRLFPGAEILRPGDPGHSEHVHFAIPGMSKQGIKLSPEAEQALAPYLG